MAHSLSGHLPAHDNLVLKHVDHVARSTRRRNNCFRPSREHEPHVVAPVDRHYERSFSCGYVQALRKITLGVRRPVTVSTAHAVHAMLKSKFKNSACSAQPCLCPMREFLCIIVTISRMREILSLMRVSVRFGRNACVTRLMRETWQVCNSQMVTGALILTVDYS